MNAEELLKMGFARNLEMRNINFHQNHKSRGRMEKENKNKSSAASTCCPHSECYKLHSRANYAFSVGVLVVGSFAQWKRTKGKFSSLRSKTKGLELLSELSAEKPNGKYVLMDLFAVRQRKIRKLFIDVFIDGNFTNIFLWLRR